MPIGARKNIRKEVGSKVEDSTSLNPTDGNTSIKETDVVDCINHAPAQNGEDEEKASLSLEIATPSTLKKDSQDIESPTTISMKQAFDNKIANQQRVLDGIIPETSGALNLSEIPFDETSPGALSASKKVQWSEKETKQAINITCQRFIKFDDNFTAELRKKCKSNRTTIAAALVVISLAAVKVAFKGRFEAANTCFSTHQGWIVTSSMRHLLPNSRLLSNGNRQSDPSLLTFGGYGSSISDPKLRLLDSSNVWKKCRSVRSRITAQFFPSMRRMKLVNWLFRHSKIWKYFEAKTDLEKLERTYSVEVANLGSWDNPLASHLKSSSTDVRLRSLDFYGAMNASFKGARALFSLAVITLDGEMSVGVSFNSSRVMPEEADLFVKTFKIAIDNMRKSSQGKVTVVQICNPDSVL